MSDENPQQPQTRRSRRKAAEVRKPRVRWSGLSRRSKRKVQAVIAGGLMFGLGAVNTLASWTHESYLGATVTTADFLVGGSVEYSTIVNFDNRRNGEWHSGSSDTFSVDTPNLRALQPEGPDNAQLRTWVRVDPSSAANIQAVRLRLVDIEVDSPNAEHLAYQVHHAQTAFDATQWSGCNGDRGTVNANTGTLITEGESLHDVSDEEGMIIPRGSNVHRICVTLMPGPGLLPNDELDLTLTFAVGPE